MFYNHNDILFVHYLITDTNETQSICIMTLHRIVNNGKHYFTPCKQETNITYEISVEKFFKNYKL